MIGWYVPAYEAKGAYSGIKFPDASRIDNWTMSGGASGKRDRDEEPHSAAFCGCCTISKS